MERKWFRLSVLVSVFIVAFFMRSYRMYPEFYSDDMALIADYVLDSVPDRWDISAFVLRENANLGNPLRLLAYQWSPLSAVLTFMNMLFFSLLGISLTEYVWVLPTIVIGSLTPVICYYLIFRLCGDRTSALIGALFIMFFPFHVLQSRYSSANEVLGFFGQVLVLLFLVNYLQKGTKSSALWFGFFMGLYIFTHLQWPGIFPVIVFAAFVFVGDKKKVGIRLKKACSHIFKKEVIIFPVVALLLLVAVSIFAGRGSPQLFGGSLGHMVSKGEASSIGWYGGYYYNWLLNNSGILLGIAITVVFFFGLREVLRLSKSSVLWCWGLTYSLPYIFYVSPKVTVAHTYYSHGFQAFTLFSAVMIAKYFFHRKMKKWIGILLVISVIASSALTIFVIAYGFENINLFGLKGFQGSYHKPIGLKAAGYWLRKKTSVDTRVFFFDYGGMGMEPTNAFYYSRRTLMALSDSPTLEFTLSYLKLFDDEIDYLVIYDSDLKYIRHYTDQAFPYAVARVESKSGDTLLWILSRFKPVSGSYDVVFTSAASQAFNKEFANLEQLTGLERYSSVSYNPYLVHYNDAFSEAH